MITPIEKNTVVDECVSTNDLARELGSRGEAQGTWISARRQKAGRGRQGRGWISDEGGLYLSIVVRPASLEKLWTWIPIAAGLAVCRVLERQGVETKLKWPNDIFIDGRKLGGILCEAQGDFVVVGIGLNYEHKPDSHAALAVPAAAFSEWKPVSHQGLQTLRTAIVKEVAQLTRTLDAKALRREFMHWTYFAPGQTVDWGTGHGKFEAIGEFGEIRVLDERGEARALFAEDVSLSSARS